MALIAPFVAARKRTPSSTAAVSFAERLAGTASGPQRLHGQACAFGAASSVVAKAAMRGTSRERPTAFRFIVGVRAFRFWGRDLATKRATRVLALLDGGRRVYGIRLVHSA